MRLRERFLVLSVMSLLFVSITFTFAGEPTQFLSELLQLKPADDTSRRINDDTGDRDQIIPALAMNKYGYIIACWIDYRNGIPSIYAQRYNYLGFPTKQNFLVNENPGIGTHWYPDAAIDNEGHSIIVWDDMRNGNYDIYAQRYDGSGNPIGANFRVDDDVSNEGQRNPAVATDGIGNFVVVWQDSRGGSWEIVLQAFDSFGNKVGDLFFVNENQDMAQTTAEIAMDQNGNFVVVWQDSRNYGVFDVYFQRYDSTMAPLGGNVEVSTHTGQESSAYAPRVALLENGTFMIVWEYGTPRSVWGRIYNWNGDPRTGIFQVNTISTLCNFADVTTYPGNTFVVAWDAMLGDGVYNIASRAFDSNGNAPGPEAVLSSESGKILPAVAADNRGNVVYIWEDDRNGHSDIYGAVVGFNMPLNVCAASGYDGMVPVTWDHPYGNSEVREYVIYRSANLTEGFTPVATVNLNDRGPLGNIMRDWIDTDVVNGHQYFYAVRANLGTDLSLTSVPDEATPDGGGHILQSSWATTTPTIDGFIEDGEWTDATTVRLKNPHSYFPVDISISNDDDFLYIAVDDYNDYFLNPGDLLTIIFDLNNNGQWDATGPSREGAITITNATTTFTGFWGQYPFALGGDLPQNNPPGIQKGVTMASGHVQYEAAFDLASSPIKTIPGSIIGFAVSISDPSVANSFKYGNSTQWPWGAFWECAAPLGDLILTEQTTVRTADDDISRPNASFLDQNYPNPFNPKTTIHFGIQATEHVILRVYDTLGKEIKTLLNKKVDAGEYYIPFDATGLTSGIYFYRIQTNEFTVVRKMILLQ